MSPQSIVMDAAGNIYFWDFLGYRIRKIATTGIVTTVVGGSGGDGGLATFAQLYPRDLARDSSGPTSIGANTGNMTLTSLTTKPADAATGQPGTDILVANNAAAGKNISISGSLDASGSSATTAGSSVCSAACTLASSDSSVSPGSKGLPHSNRSSDPFGSYGAGAHASITTASPARAGHPPSEPSVWSAPDLRPAGRLGLGGRVCRIGIPKAKTGWRAESAAP
jgi:hypothetical protein